MSEDEAAIKIQSNFRGYQCRKKYKVGGDKDLDEVTVNFIREYCYRWKAKSIFQVLLHYRAARRHDLVYFSQQVHLFNQLMVSGLQGCRKEVPLNNIDSSNKRFDSLPKLSVSKLPFHLIDNPHFWDTSALCRPQAAGDMADEAFDWDAPLRRNERGRRKNTRDQEVQTGEHTTGRRVSISHTQAPFCRYPKSAFSGYTPPQTTQANRNVKKDIRGVPSAPRHPAPPPPVNRRFDQTNENTIEGGTLSVSERRNMFSGDSHIKSNGAPGGNSNSTGGTKVSTKPPFGEQLGAKVKENKVEDKDNNKLTEIDEESDFAKSIDALFGDMEQIAEASPPKKLPADRPVNPVYEMEMKARRYEQQGDDGPPFNFQGMLRKTTYCRASLKRGNPSDGQYNSYPTKSWDDRGGHNFNNNNSNFGRMDNSQANSYTPMRPRRNSDKWKQQEDAKVIQLAPGIVLEGQEEEL